MTFNKFLILFLLPFGVLGQGKITVSGYIFDEITGEPLIGAHIKEKVSKLGTTSNEAGFYSLTIPESDSFLLVVSFIGYEEKTERITKTQSINFKLKPGLDINEVTVIQSAGGDFIRKNEMSTVKLQPKQIKKLPGFFGETDIMKVLQLTPGVQSGGEAKSDIFVRGGSPDQNLILLDGIPLYYVSHFGGFISIFNTDAIQDVNLIKGGFPARYGNRLSSVLEIRMKEGNSNKLTTQGTIGLLSSKLLFEGPLVREKASFMVSARKNLLPVFKILDAGIDYNFYDFNAKSTFKVSEKDKIFLSAYSGNDNVSVINSFNAENISQRDNRTNSWGNQFVALKWNRIFSDKLFGTNTIAYVGYNNKNNFDYTLKRDTLTDRLESQVSSGITDIMFKSDFNWYLKPRFNIRFGQHLTFHRFMPNDENFYAEMNNQPDVNRVYNSRGQALETGLYGENNLTLKNFGFNIGLRFSSYHIKSQNYFSLEPRTLLNYIVSDNFSVKYSWARMNQYIHLLTYSGVGMPNDYWMPSNQTVKPEESTQNTLGFNSVIMDGNLEFSLETYYKKMNHLISFKAGESLIGNLKDWTKTIEQEGKGTAYGLEFFLQKPRGKTTGWLSTTISKSDRVFTHLNEGRTFPFKYDRLIDASLVIVQELTKNINFSGNWSYGSGYPVTLPTERYNSEVGDVFVFEKINSYRMRDYHRLDLAVNISKETSWGEQTWSFSIFNVYNRRNPYYYYFDREHLISIDNSGGGIRVTGVEGDMRLLQKSLFRFFPSFAYSFKF
jgi:hypothetical protein